MVIISKAPVKYVHLTVKSLELVEAIDAKTFSEKLEVIIQGYGSVKEAREKELRDLEEQIARKRATLRGLREAIEAAQIVLRRHFIW